MNHASRSQQSRSGLDPKVGELPDELLSEAINCPQVGRPQMDTLSAACVALVCGECGLDSRKAGVDYYAFQRAPPSSDAAAAEQRRELAEWRSYQACSTCVVYVNRMLRVSPGKLLD